MDFQEFSTFFSLSVLNQLDISTRPKCSQNYNKDIVNIPEIFKDKYFCFHLKKYMHSDKN